MPVGPGLEVLYTFRDGGGTTISDVHESSEPLPLRIEDPSAVKWGRDGLTINGSTLISAPEPAKRLISVIRRSNAFTIEAWISPADRNRCSGRP
jgi:hypothetical protein